MRGRKSSRPARRRRSAPRKKGFLGMGLMGWLLTLVGGGAVAVMLKPEWKAKVMAMLPSKTPQA